LIEFKLYKSSRLKMWARNLILFFLSAAIVLVDNRTLDKDLFLNIRLVIKLSQRRVYVYQANQKLTSYPIAIGKVGWETPTGNFQVIQKLRNPAWKHPWTGEVVPPGPTNPLGDRWIGFWTDGENYIGFHGTTEEKLIGQAVSHGCIRMRNKDVRVLFEKVVVGTPVVVKL
jgi:lipoprotein-anchoring transpeptidase ErfK/SrfK